jgi:hypothetical protein
MNTKSGFKFVTVTISEGVARIDYRVTDAGTKVNGHDEIDGDVSDWTDYDIRDAAARLIGVPAKFASEIEVVWN